MDDRKPTGTRQGNGPSSLQLRRMRMLLILCAEERVDELHRLIEEHGVMGFTEVPGVRGVGQRGRRLGTRAHPGSVNLLFIAGEPDAIDRLLASLGEFSKGCTAGEGLRAFALDAVGVL